MSAVTGKYISEWEQVQASLADILTTPLKSRVMRRDYGSRLFELLSSPVTKGTLIDIYSAVGEAVAKWEPRFKLQKVEVISVGEGFVNLNLTGTCLAGGAHTLSLEVRR